MYVTISPQKSGGHFATSSADYVNYLEKENKQLPDQEKELFFDSESDTISPEIVTAEIDQNTAKLKKTEARFYSITINPSAWELDKLTSKEQLKEYTRSL